MTQICENIVGRGVLTSPIYENSAYIASPLFLKFCPTPLCCRLQPPPRYSFCCLGFFWLNGWSRHIWCAILLNDVMDLHMSSLSILVPEGHWCVFYATRRQVYWGLTHNVVFAGTLIWYHTHTNTQHTQGPLDWDTHINIHLHHLLCSHSSYLYYNEWIIHWYQKYTFHNVFSFQKLFTC